MKYLFLILLLFSGFFSKAQSNPSGFPTQSNMGWTKWSWVQSDSGFMLSNRIPNFTPRFPGTVILYQHAGVDSNLNFWNGARWIDLIPGFDSTSLSNRINLKLNITDTTNKWWSNTKRFQDTMYRINDSTIGFTINDGPEQTIQILGRASGGGGGGSGTVTSVALSMPSAFSVSGSPITSSGTLAVSGAGTTSQYIRGNGTLATFDTTAIPTFSAKVRSLFSGISPITYNQSSGVFGITNANTSGTKGAATFNNSDFTDNGSGLISLRNPSGNPGVDTITRTEGVDSIYFTINGVTYAIKDSTGSGSSGTVTNVSGTSNRITVTNPTTTPVIDIAATYVGQSSITTLGTITTGTWNGTVIGATFGGTGQTSVTTGDILYGSASNTWSKLADVATGNTLISGGVATAPSWGKIGLTTHVSGILPVANGGTGTATPGLVAGTNTSITGTWPNQTINATGGGGSSSLTQGYLGYGGTGDVLVGSDRFLIDSANIKMRILQVGTYTLNAVPNLAKIGAEFRTGTVWIGDSTLGQPIQIIFANPYGGANSTPLKYSIGPSGTEEFNIWVNAYYDSTQTHRVNDPAKFSQWLAFNTHYFLGQAQGIGYDWNDNDGSKIPWRFDNMEQGNKVIGGTLSTNQISIVDPMTSSYQNNDGVQAHLTVSDATLSIGGVGTVFIPDTTQLLIGPVDDGTTPDLGIQSGTTNTIMTIRNDINSSATNRIRMIKSRALNFNLTPGDVIFDLQGNTLCSYQMVAGSGTFSSFRLPDHRWTTFFSDGNEYERMRISWDGTVMVNTTSTAADIRDRRFYVNGSIGANKDSIDLQSTTSTRQMLVIDTATGKFQRMDIQGGVTSFAFTDGGGFDGTVTNATTTPTLSIAPSFTGLTFSNGTALGAATISNLLEYSSGTLQFDDAYMAASANNWIWLKSRMFRQNYDVPDANFTTLTTRQEAFFQLGDITANRTFDMSTGSGVTGQEIYVYNGNTTGNTWSFSGNAPHKSSDGSTVTTMTNGVLYHMLGTFVNSTAVWVIINQ